ncbi:MAG: NAD(P)H-dependent oxidoreductase [Thermodesulfobacteriota bacterium]
MHVYILFAHPSPRSFCREVLEYFTRGLEESGHTHEVFDLYENGFRSEMEASQYLREIGQDPEAPLPDDVKEEQGKIARSEALAFIYPVWWSDCPAKLKGWFDRVWSYGYAYFYEADGERKSLIKPQKALVICSAGHTEEHLEETGIAGAMRCIMLQDRLKNVGFTEVKMEILGGMMPNDMTFRDKNLERAYRLGRDFQSNGR